MELTTLVFHSCCGSRQVGWVWWREEESIQDTARHMSSVAVHFIYAHDSAMKYECAASPVLWMGI